MEGLEKGFFYKKEDGSVWADLTAEGLEIISSFSVVTVLLST